MQNVLLELPTWWDDRTLSPFLTSIGANIEVIVKALVPHNKFLRSVDGFTLPPPAIAEAYKQHFRWKDDEMQWYLSRLAACMCVVPTTFPREGAARSQPESVRITVPVLHDAPGVTTGSHEGSLEAAIVAQAALALAAAGGSSVDIQRPATPPHEAPQPVNIDILPPPPDVIAITDAAAHALLPPPPSDVATAAIGEHVDSVTASDARAAIVTTLPPAATTIASEDGETKQSEQESKQAERVEASSAVPAASAPLSPLMSPTFRSLSRSHHPDDVAPGRQYDPSMVRH